MSGANSCSCQNRIGKSLHQAISESLVSCGCRVADTLGAPLMTELKPEVIEQYLRSLHKKDIIFVEMSPLGESKREKAIKFIGYGTPVRINYQVRGEAVRTAVLHTMRPGPFGHEHMADRARILLWQHQSFNCLPRHVQAFDVGAFQRDGKVVSLGCVEEFCLLTEYAGGEAYFLDLERLRDTGGLTNLDLGRADTLCDYLVDIHRQPGANPELYTRRVRELVGDGECIMGIADSYVRDPIITPEKLEAIEHSCVHWRWQLKGMTHRLKQVHGDFHPWNILFRSGADFTVLDRSRGEYGDPADDVACLTLNYVFFSLQRNHRLEGPLENLFRRFWTRYLEKSGDEGVLQVIAPFFAFRALVMASPVWYPTLPEVVRLRLLAFTLAVLEQPKFDPAKVNSYCGA